MILESIRQIYPVLTKSQRKLADFVATSYQEVAFMTASTLARRVGVNEATVIRFAQRLGYGGFPELIYDIQLVVKQELRARDEASLTVSAEDSFLAAMNTIVENLHRTISHISPEVAEGAQTVLREAERILVIGQGISAPLAQMLSVSLRSLGMDADAPPSDAATLAIALDDVDERCTVVGVSAAADGNEVAGALRYATARGAHTLALTWSPVSPTAQAAELAIICPSLDPAGLPAAAVMAAVLDALTQSLSFTNREAVRIRGTRFSETREYIAHQR